MLLRSSSTPILNSWLPNSTGSSPEPENLPQLTRTRSVTLTNVEDSSSPGRSVAAQSLRDSDLINDSDTSKKVKGRIKLSWTPRPVKLKEKDDEMRRLLSSSGLGDSAAAAEEEGCLVVAEKEEKKKKKKKERVLQTLVGGGGGSVVGGGRGFIGGDGSGFGSNSHDSNSWRGPDGTDAYYRKMIEANPGNDLLLSNYAKFLKEVNNILTNFNNQRYFKISIVWSFIFFVGILNRLREIYLRLKSTLGEQSWLIQQMGLHFHFMLI